MSGAPNLVGKKIADGRYEIIKELGVGGMGAVYQARQVAMDRMVALKLIKPEVVPSPDAIARFHREMKVTAKIEHPNTVRVYDFGETDGQLFLAMELVRGRTLSDAIAPGALPLDRLVRIGMQISRALQAAHSEGVVHRDLKPDNVMLLEKYGERDVVKVLDFGVAKSLDDEQVTMTQEGALIGTPVYMSAEQALGRVVDTRSDLYTLGVMLYEMACGHVPLSAPTLTGLLVAHAHEEPMALAKAAPDVSPGLAELVDQLLKKDPAQRPQTAKEVEQRLQALVGPITGHVTVPPLSVSQDRIAQTVLMEGPSSQGKKAGGWRAGLAVFGVVAVGAVAALVVVNRGGSAPSQQAPGDPPKQDPPTSLDKNAALKHKLAELNFPALPTACDAAAGADVLTASDALTADPAAALVAADKAIERCPTWAAAFKVQGNALQRAKKYDDAERAYVRAVQLDPDYHAARHNLGTMMAMRDDYNGAVATFTSLIERKPDFPDARAMRGIALAALGKYREAIDDLELAVDQRPDHGTAWRYLGQARERAGLPGSAEAYCKAAELGIQEATCNNK